MALVPVPGTGIEVDAAILARVEATMRRWPRMRPTSGYRSPAHNAAVGGASNSDHLRGDAVDYVGPDVVAMRQWALAQGFPYVEPEALAPGHVHISYIHGGSAQPTSMTTRVARPGGQPAGGGGVTDLFADVFSGAEHQIGNVLGLVRGPLDLFRFLIALLDPKNWLRAFELLAGFGLAIMSLVIMIKVFESPEAASVPTRKPRSAARTVATEAVPSPVRRAPRIILPAERRTRP